MLIEAYLLVLVNTMRNCFICPLSHDLFAAAPLVHLTLNLPTFLPISLSGGHGSAMIELTRLNGNALVINSDLIKFAETSPDTMLTLINGEKIMVRESCAVVIERVIAYRARLLGESLRIAPEIEDGVQRAGTASAAAALRASIDDPLIRVKSNAVDPTEEAAQRRRRPEC